MKYKGNVLVAPLNWGLGHATRCIPIIHKLLEQNFNPIIASDGDALDLLKIEFPQLKTQILPGYKIVYPTDGRFLKYKLLYDSHRIFKSILEEKRITESLVKELKLTGIISDNRFGVRHPAVPSIIISHQLNVFSGNTTWISSSLNKKFLNKFDRCWVPDIPINLNISGRLSSAKLKIPIDYIGIISRLKKCDVQEDIDILILISGPPPHRKSLEDKMIETFQNQQKKIVIVKGKVEGDYKVENKNGLVLYNFLDSLGIEDLINRSKTIICRSGYSSLLDLAKLNKKAFLIPTPGQFEQIYLAKRMKSLKIAPFCGQDNFSINKLDELEDYCGFKFNQQETDFKTLFGLFEGK